jgi:hypothetical protein
MVDLVALSREEPDEKLAALVLALAGRDSVRDRQDRGPQTGSFVFSTSATSLTDIPESIAFAMS